MKRFSPLAVAVLALSITGTTTAQAATLICPALDKISQVFLNQHIGHKDATDVIEQRTIEQYVKRMDSTKIYFVEADVAAMKKSMKGIFNKLRKGDCSPLDTVQKSFLTRVEERAAFAKKTLTAKTFKFEPNTELVLDPDSRKFPKTKAESETLQAKYLQFQVSNYIATGMKQEEAQEQVVRNYERVVKRVKDTTQEDIYSGYLDSFARSLDPHSSYFSADSLDDFEIQMSLSLEGIGATLSSQDGFTVIEQLIEGGSAKASGKLKS
ncbi:MAG: tail-specific protease, partial [Bdellovibrionota bacterium]